MLTELSDTSRSAAEGNIPFPQIPDVTTMVKQNMTRQPTFFGCNDSAPVPLVLYLPNSPWSSYSNFSYQKSSFTNEQFNDTVNNAFNLATYGNGTIDPEWPQCLACAVIKGAMGRAGIEMPEQCTQCFQRHCWNGNSSAGEVSSADWNLTPRLNASLTYEEWNRTVWNAGGSKRGGDSGASSSSSSNSAAVSLQSKQSVYFSVLASVLMLVTSSIMSIY